MAKYIKKISIKAIYLIRCYSSFYKTKRKGGQNNLYEDNKNFFF